MKAYILESPGPVSHLKLVELPVPEPGDNEVLIHTSAISINPVDIKTRNGHAIYPMLKANKPLVLGWDISGKVIAKGKAVTSLKVGDDVFGMVNFAGHGQAYAEYVVAPAEHLAIKPASISYIDAAAATLAALTAWQAFAVDTKVKPGSKVLIHAAAGGVGHYAVQIARYLGANVTGTSSLANRDFVLGLGANNHIDYHHQRFETLSQDYDIILETMGGDNFIRSLDAVKKTGTVINLVSDDQSIRREFPSTESTVNIAKARGIHSIHSHVASSGNNMQQIATLMEQGIIKSHIYKTYTFDQLPETHIQIESGRTVGKLVVVV